VDTEDETPADSSDNASEWQDWSEEWQTGGDENAKTDTNDTVLDNIHW
jgi:hypothetical protein